MIIIRTINIQTRNNSIGVPASSTRFAAPSSLGVCAHKEELEHVEDAKERRRAHTMTACANASVMPLTARKLIITANPPESKEDTRAFNSQQKERGSLLAHREQPTLPQLQPICFRKATSEQAANTAVRCKPARCGRASFVKLRHQHSALGSLN